MLNRSLFRQRVAILGPVLTESLDDFIVELKNGNDIPPGTRGTCVLNLVRARLNRGLPTDIITCDASVSDTMRVWSGSLVNLWIVKRRTRRAMRDAYMRERRLIHEALSQSDASICHANWTYEYAMAGLTQNRIPCVVSVHDHAGHILRLADARYLINYLITRYVFHRAHHLTAPSPYVADYVSRVSGKQAQVVPNLLPDSEWSEQGTREASGPVILTTGHWGREKNIRRALRAFRIVLSKYPDARYVLVGPGLGSRGEAHRWAQKRKFNSNVEFAGELPYRCTVSRIAASDVLFHPSMEESFGMSVAEGMAAGTPVVGCREAQGVRWLLDDGKAGQMASGLSPDDMARALQSALSGSTDVQEMAAAAEERIQTLCDPAESLRLFDDVYLRALAESSGTGRR